MDKANLTTYAGMDSQSVLLMGRLLRRQPGYTARPEAGRFSPALPSQRDGAGNIVRCAQREKRKRRTP